jgi:hypothetical protein
LTLDALPRLLWVVEHLLLLEVPERTRRMKRRWWKSQTMT